MNNTTTSTTTTNLDTFAEAIRTLVTGMIDARRRFAADNGFTATDDEIVASVKASLVRMRAERAARA